jgi:Zn-dependent protease with chaperone function
MSEPAPLYPPNPRNVPADFTEPNWSYCSRVLLVLACLVLFIVVYVGLVAGSAYVCYTSFMALKGSVSGVKEPPQNPYARPAAPRGRTARAAFPALHITLMLTSSLLFLFLLKGFFKLRKHGKSLDVEITEQHQPAFFAFLRQLCKDTGAPLPHRVFLTPDVNAMVVYDSPLRSLFLPTPKNLVLGLALVNQLILTELKAVLAHEFGHFSQSSMKLGTYVYQVNRLIGDMVYARDFFDDMVQRLRGGDPRIAFFGWIFAGILWGLRKALEGLFRTVNFANSALSRQMEFNADLVAVSVTGSDSLVHALARIEFADQALAHAMNDLVAAGDHKHYTRDLFVHQTRALDYLRQEKNDPRFGEVAPLPEDAAGAHRIFKPGDTGVPLMWATHPSNFDREQNAKNLYLRGVIDDRPAWALFSGDAAVREQVTARFFEVIHQVPATGLADPAKVQAFIDAEHAETTYPARFLGMYDDRYLELGDIDSWVHTPPEYRDAEYLSEQQARLYGPHVQPLLRQVQERREDSDVLHDLLEGRRTLQGQTFTFRGCRYTAFDVEDLLKTVEAELDADRKRLGAEDRLVFQVHYAMAQQQNDVLALELVARYRFHAGAQEILQKTSQAMAEMNEVLEELAGQSELSEEYFRQVIRFFQEMHLTLKTSLDTAGRLRIPRLENMVEGQPLSEFLLPEPLISYLSNSTRSLNGKWLDRMAKQTAEIADRSRRIHSKSLGGIFALQDKIAAQWGRTSHEPARDLSEPSVVVDKKTVPVPCTSLSSSD